MFPVARCQMTMSSLRSLLDLYRASASAAHHPVAPSDDRELQEEFAAANSAWHEAIPPTCLLFGRTGGLLEETLDESVKLMQVVANDAVIKCVRFVYSVMLVSVRGVFIDVLARAKLEDGPDDGYDEDDFDEEDGATVARVATDAEVRALLVASMLTSYCRAELVTLRPGMPHSATCACGIFRGDDNGNRDGNGCKFERVMTAASENLDAAIKEIVRRDRLPAMDRLLMRAAYEASMAASRASRDVCVGASRRAEMRGIATAHAMRLAKGLTAKHEHRRRIGEADDLSSMYERLIAQILLDV